MKVGRRVMKHMCLFYPSTDVTDTHRNEKQRNKKVDDITVEDAIPGLFGAAPTCSGHWSVVRGDLEVTLDPPGAGWTQGYRAGVEVRVRAWPAPGQVDSRR
ncbi:hypothetical protein ElyMa_002779900 [Elysia marginata]|uniref:Arrestin-like N-terminal domain-containing protein n=1 Tax=Elysia marginata TaxID=1093978 RepID=A0AAV4HNV9_9GAST|nr:hypothetical protein ElyMa_002779900 [Elysia marginata]